MPRKVYRIEGVDCANCAARIEANMNRHPHVEEAVITFATGQLRITAVDPDSLLPELTAIARKIEEGAVITEWEGHGHHHKGSHEHHHHEGCGCGHEHHHHGSCDCGHEHYHQEAADSHDHESGEWKPLVAGAGLFLLGLVLEGLKLPWPAGCTYVVAYVILGLEVLATAGRNLVKGHVFDENFLMSLATLGAFAIGEFPEAVGVMLFYRVGEYFEHKAVERSRSQIMEAVDLRPEVVTKLEGEQTRTIPAENAAVGDTLLVRPGDRIPLDGIVLSGASRVDTAPITGEPVPVSVKPGDQVVSGCVNQSGRFTMKVEKILSESMVTRILNSVENAAASKPQMDRFITRFARIYTPVVVSLAALTAVVPSLIDGNWNYWVYTALSFLVMSCPCALVLSVPLAFFSGIGAGSKGGILFKGGLSIEAMAGIKAVAMDKTGTMTKGDFTVQSVSGGEEVLKLCAAAEQSSTHPIGVSIVAAAVEKGLSLQKPEEVEEFSGHGIRAVVEGRTVLCGNKRLMDRFGVALPHIAEAEGRTQILVAVDGTFAGHILIADSLKADAVAGVARLKKMSIATVMLTGDKPESARAVADQTGMDEVHAGLLPEEKLTHLQQIRSRLGATMFVGDGINDAPVLAGADVGAAMGSGADAAIEAADVVYMTSAVDAIGQSLTIARQTRQIAWQNVVFALAVKLIVMVLGLMGHASMWMAVFADSGVAMLCVLNSIRLLYKKSG